MRSFLPSGTITFLFTDVEGSTKLLHALGAEAYAAALAEHRRILRAAFVRHGGLEVDTQGDAFFVAFPTAPGALAAAREAQAVLAEGPIRVRIGIHTGTPHLTQEGYVGTDVHRAARIAAAGHGGQVLVSAATTALVGIDGLHDLGDHRLKDLSAPERIYQLGDGEFPPLKTLHQTNLPVPATPFLGREDEIGDLTELLARDGVRLVTLTGTGGTGKTRLALAVAGGLADRYPDGVWWVPLAPLRDPALVLESAATALGASGDLAEHVADKRQLLLLDNFEHLMPAADDVARLLARCQNLSLLVTSREPLHISGEHEYAVDPLQRHDAVQLFLTRALAARRDVAANGELAEICERLDNLPLAIELAAARVKVLTPKALLERLEQRLPILAGGARDLPHRQRTLRATIEWSHELLTPDEQRLFARLSVFRGGCGFGAAEAVADADLDTLTSLVDKSLLRVRDDRIGMLETIREYALERLEMSGEADELRRRHAEHYLALAEEAEPHLRGSDQAEWLDRLEADYHNIETAISTGVTTRDADLALRFVLALDRYWWIRGRLAGAASTVADALSVPGGSSERRGGAMRIFGMMLADLGEVDRGIAMLEESVRLLDSARGGVEAALARLRLGDALMLRADFAPAVELFTAARSRLIGLQDDSHLPMAEGLLGIALLGLGRLEDSEAAHRRTKQLELDRGDWSGAAVCEFYLGTIALRRGDFIAARLHLETARGTFGRIKQTAGRLFAEAGLVRVDALDGDASAIEHVAALLAADEVSEDASLIAYILETIAYLSLRRDRRDLAEQLALLAAAYSRRFPGFEQLMHDEISECRITLGSELPTVPPSPADAIGLARTAVAELRA